MRPCGLAAAIYICDDVRAQVQLASLRLAQQKSNCFSSSLSFPIPIKPSNLLLALSAPPPPHAARTSRQPTLPSAPIELVVRGLFGLLMGRHAGGVVLLALTVVLLLAAVSDGIRPAPAAGANEPAHGSTTAEMVVAAPPSAAQQLQGGRRSSGGDKEDDDDLALREEVVRATGSSLPDCSHACGACSPCSRVMVSFKCSAAEPLPCPMVYRCMCRGKCYPVPSS